MTHKNKGLKSAPFWLQTTTLDPPRPNGKRLTMHREIDFENDIEQALTRHGGFDKGDPNTYDPETALFPADILAFVHKT